ncbi:glycosyl transferase [Leisingera sp. D0M16]|uniref:glycosyl transferase n=1 Tax=Leisingera coralii TaxID=3351347 RepID=UPI003B7C084A
MITLQNVITPEPEICTEHSLYYHVQGAAGFSQSSGDFSIPRSSRLCFDTYFNLFNLGIWTAACDLQSLYAEVTGRGRAEVRVIHARSGRSWEVVYCEVTELSPESPHLADLSALPAAGLDGLLYLEILSLDDLVTVESARFATTALPQALPRLAVSITTFRREAEVQGTVARLQAFLDGFAFADRVHVQVVDNGQSADIPPSSHVTLYPNPNLGGAGGFARGLLEAQDGGFSHCLFMDDDASFHMENILRAYMLLALARDPKTALAGAMINNTHKWRMWENGAWFDGACRPLFNGTDLRDPGAVREMEFAAAGEQPATLYGGWWFFAFPVAEVRHHPFPFFVRGDDISFSLANGFRIFTLNGVVSFQDDFTEKENPQTLYLDLRNHLIHHLVFDQLDRSPLGTAKIALRFMMRSLLRCKYESAEAQLLAWQDVMQGPQFFDENIDMSARRADIKALIRDEAWKDAASQPAPGPRRFSRLPRRLRHYLGLLSLNGHLVPFWARFGDRMQLDIGGRGLVFPAFGGARLTYLSTDGSKGYTVHHSKRRFFSLAWRMAKTLQAFCSSYPQLRTAYRQGYGKMTARPYWEKTLNRLEDRKAA